MKWTNDPPNILDNQLGKKQTMRMDAPRPGEWIKVPSEDMSRTQVDPTNQGQIALQMEILQNEIKNLQSKIYTLRERLDAVLTPDPESPNADIEIPVALTPLAREIFIEATNITDLSAAVKSILQRLEL